MIMSSIPSLLHLQLCTSMHTGRSRPCSTCSCSSAPTSLRFGRCRSGVVPSSTSSMTDEIHHTLPVLLSIPCSPRDIPVSKTPLSLPVYLSATQRWQHSSKIATPLSLLLTMRMSLCTHLFVVKAFLSVLCIPSHNKHTSMSRPVCIRRQIFL